MHDERVRNLASMVTLALFFLALVMSNATNAAQLDASPNHTGEDHSFENHADENLTSITLTDATLEGSNLRNTLFDDAIAIRTNFSNAQLRGTSFTGATLTDANFSGSQLRDAELTGAFAAGADFSDVIWRDATIAGVNLDGANLSGSNANGADFSGSSFLGADLSGILNADPAAFSGAFYDLTTIVDPGFDTSQMVFLPEPRPIVYLMTGLLTFCVLPRTPRANPIGSTDLADASNS